MSFFLGEAKNGGFLLVSFEQPQTWGAFSTNGTFWHGLSNPTLSHTPIEANLVFTTWVAPHGLEASEGKPKGKAHPSWGSKSENKMQTTRGCAEHPGVLPQAGGSCNGNGKLRARPPLLLVRHTERILCPFQIDDKLDILIGQSCFQESKRMTAYDIRH